MILAFLEHSRGVPSTLSLEVLTFARKMGNRSQPVEALVIGADGRVIAENLAPFGVSTLHLPEDARLRDYVAEAWAQALVELIGSLKPDAVIGTGSDRGMEVMAHAAARLRLPLAANVTKVDREEQDYTVTRQRWGGSLLEEARLKAPVKLMTVAPHAVAAEPAASNEQVSLRTFNPKLTDKEFRVRMTVEPDAAGGKLSLAQARVVVGGGRGVGSAEGFAALEELASLLGGTVGCSRAVTSLGWRPHSDQVGQTGTRIAPDLYIACGISGAIQHMVGCRAAKHILAINSDPEAPIVAQADYAVIGDVKQIVPAVSNEIKRARAKLEEVRS
jgi:electron transfer flavoprotein alpha subunit